MEVKNIIVDITEIGKRAKNLAPPVIKDCNYRLLVNKLTWMLIFILMLPCLLGLWSYYDFSDERQMQEVNGEKIYYDIESGELLHEQGSVIFLELSNIFSIGFVGIVIAIML